MFNSLGRILIRNSSEDNHIAFLTSPKTVKDFPKELTLHLMQFGQVAEYESTLKTNPRDVRYTVVKGKVYRTSDTTLRNLLFYIKGKKNFSQDKER